MHKFSFNLLCLLLVCIFLFLCPVCVQASQASRDSLAYNNYLKGLLFDQKGQYKQATDAYQQAIKSDFQSWDIHYRLALDYLRLKDFKKAEKEFNFILNLKPYDEKTRFLLALVYTYNSNFKAAINQYHQLLKGPLLELKESDVRYSLAQLYYMQKQLDKAEKEYKIILQKNPDDSYAHFYLGYIYNELSQNEIAIKEFNKSLELNPLNPLALNALSYLYAELGQNLDEALSLVQKALELEPANGAYLDTLGWIYFKKGQIDKAIKYLEHASVLIEDAEVFEHLGDVYFKMGKPQQALKNWRKSLEIDPKRKQVKDKIKETKKKR